MGSSADADGTTSKVRVRRRKIRLGVINRYNPRPFIVPSLARYSP
jgi:hypothetical protein